MNENTHDIIADTDQKKIYRRLNFALIRAIAALLAAGILLAATGFAVIDLLRGPKEITAIQDEEQGTFVSRDVFAILGFYADDVKGDTVTGRYALVPMGGKLVSVYFTQRYLESADTVCDETYDYINGKISALDHYVKVQGTVGKLSENASGLMYDWFGLNKDQLVEMRMIDDTEDYADYLTDEVLIVDTVNGYGQNLIVSLSVISGLLLLYMAVELVLMAVGFYLPGRGKKSEAEFGEPVEPDFITSENESGTLGVFYSEDDTSESGSPGAEKTDGPVGPDSSDIMDASVPRSDTDENTEDPK